MGYGITFKGKRLFVGWRRGPQTLVWYEPIGEGDEDHPPGVGLFKTHKGDGEGREPREDEVNWDGQFEISGFGGKKPSTKVLLQQRLLWDTWRFMMAKTPEEIEEARARLDTDDPMWKAVLATAGPAKDLQQRKASYARKKRETARRRGDPAASIEDMDLDTDDEGFFEDFQPYKPISPLSASFPPSPSSQSSAVSAKQRPAVPLFNENHRGNARMGSRVDTRASTSSEDFERTPVGDELTSDDLASGLFTGLGPTARSRSAARSKRSSDASSHNDRGDVRSFGGTGEGGRRLGGAQRSSPATQNKRRKSNSPVQREESIFLSDDEDDNQGRQGGGIDFANGGGTEEEQFEEAVRRSASEMPQGQATDAETAAAASANSLGNAIGSLEQTFDQAQRRGQNAHVEDEEDDDSDG